MKPRSTILAALLVAASAQVPAQGPFTLRFVSDVAYSYTPHVAYDRSNDLFGVALQLRSPTRIGFRRFRRDGTIVGTFPRIAGADSYVVGNVGLNMRDAFIVVFREWTGSRYRILARGVLAGSGTLTNTVLVASDVHRVDVGGDATTTDDDAVVVWSVGRQIFGAQISLSSSGTLSVFGQTTISQRRSDVESIQISKSGGPLGNYLVAWSENNFTEMHGTFVTRNLASLSSVFVIDPRGTRTRSPTSIDGDGRNFVIAYTKQEAAGSSIDVFTRAVTYDRSQIAVGPERPVESDPNDPENQGSVAWTGDSALVSYRDATSSGSDFYAKSVDPFTCLICEPEFALDGANGHTGFAVDSVSEFSGFSTSGGVMTVWTRRENVNGTSVGRVLARHTYVEDGIARNRSGGCGTGGTATASCARSGHAGFHLRVRGTTGSTAYCVLSPYRIDSPCGPCKLVPDPFRGVVVLTSLDAAGNAEVAIPLPNSSGLQGIRFFNQWIVPGSGTNRCSLPAASFSDALEVEIQ